MRDASTGEQCRYYENTLDWNAAGVTGPTGPTGPGLPAVEGQVDVDSPSVPASSCIVRDVTIAALQASDHVLINPTGNLPLGIVVEPMFHIGSSTTLELRTCNVTGAAFDPPNGSWGYVLFRG